MQCVCTTSGIDGLSRVSSLSGISIAYPSRCGLLSALALTGIWHPSALNNGPHGQVIFPVNFFKIVQGVYEMRYQGNNIWREEQTNAADKEPENIMLSSTPLGGKGIIIFMIIYTVALN